MNLADRIARAESTSTLNTTTSSSSDSVSITDSDSGFWDSEDERQWEREKHQMVKQTRQFLPVLFKLLGSVLAGRFLESRSLTLETWASCIWSEFNTVLQRLLSRQQ